MKKNPLELKNSNQNLPKGELHRTTKSLFQTKTACLPPKPSMTLRKHLKSVIALWLSGLETLEQTIEKRLTSSPRVLRPSDEGHGRLCFLFQRFALPAGGPVHQQALPKAPVRQSRSVSHRKERIRPSHAARSEAVRIIIFFFCARACGICLVDH